MLFRPGDFVECVHCNAKFKQYKSCQTHVEKSHSNIYNLELNDEDAEIESKEVEAKYRVGGGDIQLRSTPVSSQPPATESGPGAILPDVILPNRLSPINVPAQRHGQPVQISAGNIIKARAPNGNIVYLRAADNRQQPATRPGQGPTRLFPGEIIR